MTVVSTAAFVMTPLPLPAVQSLFRPQIAALPGEGFVLAAGQPDEEVPNVTRRLVVGSIRGAAGEALVDTFPVASGGLDQREIGDVAASPAGIAFAWSDSHPFVPAGNSARVRVFDMGGVPLGGEAALPQVSTGNLSAARQVVAFPDGRFAVVWSWSDASGQVYEYRLTSFQLVAATGEPEGDPISAFDSGSSPGPYPVRAAADGDILLIAATTEAGTLLRRFAETGEALGEPVLLRADRADLVDLDILADGSLAATWATGDGTYVGRFDTEGHRVAPDVLVLGVGDQSLQIEPLQDGGFIAVAPDAVDAVDRVVARIFDRDGLMVDEALVPAGGSLASLDLATLDDGRVALATWTFADGRSMVGGQILDDGASHVPQPGGTTVTIGRWWEQDAIGRGDGVDTLLTADSLTLKPFIANLVFSGAGDLNADGNAMANLMTGNGGANVLVGYLGNDSLVGGDGDDFLAAGRGDDTSLGGLGDDIVWGGQGRDLIRGGEGADTLNGDRHDDVVDGEGGDDLVNGGAGADRLLGGNGDDLVTGGQGGDSLLGGAGADTLLGDQGDDSLSGGADGDRFLFADRSGRDTIGDFDYAAGDRIVVRLDADGTVNGMPVTATADLWARSADALHGFTVDLGGGNTVTLWGQISYGLDAGIFEIVV